MVVYNNWCVLSLKHISYLVVYLNRFLLLLQYINAWANQSGAFTIFYSFNCWDIVPLLNLRFLAHLLREFLLLWLPWLAPLRNLLMCRSTSTNLWTFLMNRAPVLLEWRDILLALLEWSNLSDRRLKIISIFIWVAPVILNRGQLFVKCLIDVGQLITTKC
jgi:hypothetical protein